MPNFYFSSPNILLALLSTLILGIILIGIKKVNDETGNIKKFERGYYLYLLGVCVYCILAGTGFFPQTDTFPPKFPLIFVFDFIFFFLILIPKIDRFFQFLKNHLYIGLSLFNHLGSSLKLY